ncbi:hypothetical protein BpHYR1_049451 [Brachionus plicatilis]|uniref:Uncharacterized protein n=1 Tax=Brachionus plicatilis TaxID=10195 RepID=A0A3M7SB27_BRAPC|nr:hypothetical protein BpHYR1_049451 [Brachionus plicatilis]
MHKDKLNFVYYKPVTNRCKTDEKIATYSYLNSILSPVQSPIPQKIVLVYSIYENLVPSKLHAQGQKISSDLSLQSYLKLHRSSMRWTSGIRFWRDFKVNFLKYLFENTSEYLWFRRIVKY